MATSLAALSPMTVHKNEFVPQLLASIFRQFEQILRRLALGDCELTARWNELDVLRGRPVRVDVGTHAVEGQGRGIDAAGCFAWMTAGRRRGFLEARCFDDWRQ